MIIRYSESRAYIIMLKFLFLSIVIMGLFDRVADVVNEMIGVAI